MKKKKRRGAVALNIINPDGTKMPVVLLRGEMLTISCPFDGEGDRFKFTGETEIVLELID